MPTATRLISSPLKRDLLFLARDLDLLAGLGCDFEELDLCTWTQEKHNDDFDWEVQVASAGGLTGGPTVDHTFQTGTLACDKCDVRIRVLRPHPPLVIRQSVITIPGNWGVGT
jgi:hypothetical protein